MPAIKLTSAASAKKPPALKPAVAAARAATQAPPTTGKGKGKADPAADVADDVSKWDSIELPDSLVAAAENLARSKTNNFGATLSLCKEIRKTRTLLSAPGPEQVLQRQQVQKFLARRLLPYLAAHIVPTLAGLDLRAKKVTDSPEVQKALSTWNAELSHYGNLGALLARFASLKINIEADYPTIGIQKLRFLFPLWKAECAAADLSFRKIEDVPRTSAILANRYRWIIGQNADGTPSKAGIPNREAIKALTRTFTGKSPRGSKRADTGVDSADSVAAALAAGASPTGTSHVTYPTAASIIGHLLAVPCRYSLTEFAQIIDAAKQGWHNAAASGAAVQGAGSDAIDALEEDADAEPSDEDLV